VPVLGAVVSEYLNGKRFAGGFDQPQSN
jgi:hypothetical protein